MMMSGCSIIILGLVVGAITFTVSITSIFLWFREFVSKIHPKIDELIHCPWCSGFWLSILLVSFTNLELPTIFNIGILNIITNAFAVLCVAGVLHYVLLRTYTPVSEYLAIRRLKKQKENREK